MSNDVLKIRAGFVGFGEVNTPREFIDNRCRIAADELKKRGIELVETAPVSDDPAGLQAARAVEELKKVNSMHSLSVSPDGSRPGQSSKLLNPLNINRCSCGA